MVEVGMSCVFHGKTVPGGGTRIGTGEEWRPPMTDPKEGEGSKMLYEVVEELVRHCVISPALRASLCG
jgi:hypothetical protein